MTDDIQENKTLLKQIQTEKRQVTLLVKQAELLQKSVEFTNRMSEAQLMRLANGTDFALQKLSSVTKQAEEASYRINSALERGTRDWWEFPSMGSLILITTITATVCLSFFAVRGFFFGFETNSVSVHIPEIQLKIAQESEKPVLELPQVAIPMAEPVEPPEQPEKTEALEIVPPAEAEAPDTAAIMKNELQ